MTELKNLCAHREKIGEREWQQVPCPPMCPYQSWPRYMFRLTFFRGRWKLRKKYR